MMTDKYGRNLREATLTEVLHVPTAAFNLFSVTRMMTKGWKLLGNTEDL